MSELKAELRAIAESALFGDEIDTTDQIESALHAAVKRVLEQEPNEELFAWNRHRTGDCSKGCIFSDGQTRMWFARVTAQLLREIEE